MHAANRQLDGPGGVLLTWTGCWIASWNAGPAGAVSTADAACGKEPGLPMPGTVVRVPRSREETTFRPHSAGERHPPQRFGKCGTLRLCVFLGQLLPSFSAVSSSCCRHVERAARGAPASDTQGSAGGSALTAQPPLPAGPTPSQIARTVCSEQGQREIGEILGLEANVW